jgi:ribosomal protein S18 acetylase RimI-like enzyme
MQPADLDAVVQVHLSSFSRFFLSSMGASFLKEFYGAALADKSSIALVSQEGETLSGFAVGTMQPEGFYGRIARKHWHRLLLRSARPILKKPQIALGMLRRLSMMGQTRYGPRGALLMSIAVEPAKQGAGIGKRLVEEFLSAAKQRGAISVCLTTDELNNEGANQFYVRSGFNRLRSFTAPEGRRMNEYGRSLQ